MRFETHHEIYLPAGQCWHIWHIHWIFYNQKKKKKPMKNRNLIFDINTKISEMCSTGFPRRARWVYFCIWNLKWIVIWEIEDATTYCEVLGGFVAIIVYVLALYGILRCDVFFFANLRFHCLERFIYTIISFVLVCFCLTFHVLLFVICRTLFRAVINWICCFVYFFSLHSCIVSL